MEGEAVSWDNSTALTGALLCSISAWCLGSHQPETARQLGGVFPRGPQRGVVCHRRVDVCIEHRFGASGGPGGRGGVDGRRAGPVRGAGVAGDPGARMAVRAVLREERRVHHARIPRTALFSRRALVSRGRLDHQLRADQDLGHDLRGRRGVYGAHGHRVLDRRHHRRARHGHLYGVRRSARRALYRHDPGPGSDRRSPSPSAASTRPVDGVRCARKPGPA